MEARKGDYKKNPFPYDLRHKRRTATNELRKDKRSQVLRRKRRTISESADYEVTVSQVKVATEGLKKDKQGHVDNLKVIRNAFAQGSALVDAFLEVENSMQCLVGLLTGSDPEVQLLAEWCLTNMAAGTEEHAEIVLKAAGSYLITFLSSPSAPLQDQSAWTLGNVACGEEECKQLVAWGVLPSLTPLLQSSCVKVIKSATFALSNLARNDDAKKQMVELGVVEKLMEVMAGCHGDDLDLLIECIWVLTYIAACKESSKRMLEGGVTDKLVAIFIHHSHLTPLHVQLLTPVGRCLGNLFCDADEAVIHKATSTKQVASVAMETAEAIPEAGEPTATTSATVVTAATVTTVATSTTTATTGDVSAFLTGLEKLLLSTLVHLNKEALWILSNIAVFKGEAERIVYCGVHKSIISLLSSVYNVSYESVCCLGNMSMHGNEVCMEMCKSGCVGKLVPLLTSNDLHLVQATLNLLHALLLASAEEGAHVFEEHKGLKALELLEYHPNQNIAQKTNEILEKCIYVYQDK